MVKASFHIVTAIATHGFPSLVDCRRLATVDGVVTLHLGAPPQVVVWFAWDLPVTLAERDEPSKLVLEIPLLNAPRRIVGYVSPP